MKVTDLSLTQTEVAMTSHAHEAYFLELKLCIMVFDLALTGIFKMINMY